MEKNCAKPNIFEKFRVAKVRLPYENWSKMYDMEREVIWINTAVENENNVVKIEPAKW